MAIAHSEFMAQSEQTAPMTYEEYMAEPPVKLRYDILDGVRCVTNPTPEHQDIQGNIYEAFRRYQRAQQNGRTMQAPSDVLIRRAPLRTRQPDVHYMSNTRLAQNPPRNSSAPRNPAPELVVEVVSPANTPTELNERLTDYHSVNVQECWIVYPQGQSVVVYTARPAGFQVAATYTSGQVVQSLAFAGLSMAVDEVFAI